MVGEGLEDYLKQNKISVGFGMFLDTRNGRGLYCCFGCDNKRFLIAYVLNDKMEKIVTYTERFDDHKKMLDRGEALSDEMEDDRTKFLYPIST